MPNFWTGLGRGASVDTNEAPEGGDELGLHEMDLAEDWSGQTQSYIFREWWAEWKEASLKTLTSDETLTVTITSCGETSC